MRGMGLSCSALYGEWVRWRTILTIPKILVLKVVIMILTTKPHQSNWSAHSTRMVRVTSWSSCMTIWTVPHVRRNRNWDRCIMAHRSAIPRAKNNKRFSARMPPPSDRNVRRPKKPLSSRQLLWPEMPRLKTISIQVLTLSEATAGMAAQMTFP